MTTDATGPATGRAATDHAVPPGNRVPPGNHVPAGERGPAGDRTAPARTGSSTGRARGAVAVVARATVRAAGRMPGAVAQRGSGRSGPPRGGVNGQPHSGTYVADTYAGDLDATSGGSPTLAHDGEPAGLARVTLALQPPAEKLTPAPGRLIGLCSWAATIGVLGALVAAWAGFEFLIGAPAWFLPTAATMGIVGVGLTVGAFFTAREPVIPWTLLGLASCMLGAAALTIVLASQPIGVV